MPKNILRPIALLLAVCLIAESGVAVPACEAFSVKREANGEVYASRGPHGPFEEQALLLPVVAGVGYLGGHGKAFICHILRPLAIGAAGVRSWTHDAGVVADLEQWRVALRVVKEGKNIAIEISDNGIGITVGDQGQLIPNRKPTRDQSDFLESKNGIGLILSDILTRIHKGLIEYVISEPPENFRTTIRLVFPRNEIRIIPRSGLNTPGASALWAWTNPDGNARKALGRIGFMEGLLTGLAGLGLAVKMFGPLIPHAVTLSGHFSWETLALSGAFSLLAGVLAYLPIFLIHYFGGVLQTDGKSANLRNTDWQELVPIAAGATRTALLGLAGIPFIAAGLLIGGLPGLILIPASLLAGGLLHAWRNPKPPAALPPATADEPDGKVIDRRSLVGLLAGALAATATAENTAVAAKVLDAVLPIMPGVSGAAQVVDALPAMYNMLNIFELGPRFWSNSAELDGVDDPAGMAGITTELLMKYRQGALTGVEILSPGEPLRKMILDGDAKFFSDLRTAAQHDPDAMYYLIGIDNPELSPLWNRIQNITRKSAKGRGLGVNLSADPYGEFEKASAAGMTPETYTAQVIDRIRPVVLDQLQKAAQGLSAEGINFDPETALHYYLEAMNKFLSGGGGWSAWEIFPGDEMVPQNVFSSVQTGLGELGFVPFGTYARGVTERARIAELRSLFPDLYKHRHSSEMADLIRDVASGKTRPQAAVAEAGKIVREIKRAKEVFDREKRGEESGRNEFKRRQGRSRATNPAMMGARINQLAEELAREALFGMVIFRSSRDIIHGQIANSYWEAKRYILEAKGLLPRRSYPYRLIIDQLTPASVIGRWLKRNDWFAWPEDPSTGTVDVLIKRPQDRFLPPASESLPHPHDLQQAA
jgi:hypothetical protein